MGQATEEFRLYQICVKERLDDKWSGWIDNVVLDYCDGMTILTCPVADQAALQGILRQLYSLGLTMVSVNPVERQESQRETGAVDETDDAICADSME